MHFEQKDPEAKTFSMWSLVVCYFYALLRSVLRTAFATVLFYHKSVVIFYIFNIRSVIMFELSNLSMKSKTSIFVEFLKYIKSFTFSHSELEKRIFTFSITFLKKKTYITMMYMKKNTYIIK